MKAMALPVATLLLAACSTAPGTGWARAPDLSVYAAMDLFGGMAREQLILCQGFSPAAVAADWARDYGAREAVVTDALAARHGADAVARAERDRPLRVECEDVPDTKWRDQYARLLRLLEARLGLA